MLSLRLKKQEIVNKIIYLQHDMMACNDHGKRVGNLGSFLLPKGYGYSSGSDCCFCRIMYSFPSLSIEMIRLQGARLAPFF